MHRGQPSTNLALAVAKGGSYGMILAGPIMMVLGFVLGAEGFFIFHMGLIAFGVGLCILLLSRERERKTCP